MNIFLPILLKLLQQEWSYMKASVRDLTHFHTIYDRQQVYGFMWSFVSIPIAALHGEYTGQVGINDRSAIQLRVMYSLSISSNKS